MSDEQTIYISPEDDLTTVRERLEEITSRRVTLVIPSHTQLRSHVAWKLLYARSRELGKEVLIVSSDPQVRSVAHAVKFKVAHSLESNPQGRSRPTSRPTRSTGVRSRLASGRTSTPKNMVRNTNSLRQRPPEPEEEVWYAPTPEKRTATGQKRPDYQIEEVNGDDITDVSISSRYKKPEKTQSSTYEYRINQPDALSPIRPVPSDPIEEESDMWAEDYAHTEKIREAAGLSKQEQPDVPSTPGLAGAVSLPDNRAGSHERHEIRDTKSIPPLADPFEHEEYSKPALLHEQQGNATIEDIDTIEHEVHDVAELPTTILEHKIEYRDDNDDYLLPAIQGTGSPGTQNRQEVLGEDEDEEGDLSQDNARRVHGTRPRRSRSGYLSPSTQESQAEHQPAKDNYGTQIISPRPFVEPTTPVSRSGGKEPDPVQLPNQPREGSRSTDARVARARSGDLRSAGPRSGDLRSAAGPRSGNLRSTGPRSGDLRSAAGPRSGNLRSTGPRSGDLRSRSSAIPNLPPRPPRPTTGTGRANTGLRTPIIPGLRTTTQRNRRGNILLITAVIVVLLALALLIYAGPSAHVTLTVTAHNYTHAVDLTASSNNQIGALPARLLVQDFHKKGSEPVTGSKLVGKGIARGFVCFTNKNNAIVDIPTGSIVSTSTGVQFATTADGVVPALSTCTNDPLVFPIQAIKPGETGNVPADSITVIPDSSLDAIAKNNKVATTSLKLTVNNSELVNGGGMQPAPTITAKDLDNAKTDLSNQLKGEIDTWVQNISKDGITGDVVKNATLVDAPLPDTILDSGTTFPAEVDVKASMLFVNNTELQKYALNQLNTDISQDKSYSGYTIAQDAKPAIVISQLKKQSAANSLKINFSAAAQAIPVIPKETVQNLVSGRTPDAARTLLINSIRGTQNVRIQITPGFFPWVSWWKGHIDVTVLPGSSSNTPPTHS